MRWPWSRRSAKAAPASASAAGPSTSSAALVSTEQVDELLARFVDIEPPIVLSVLEECQSDLELAAERLLDMLGTSALPPMKECVICLSEPRMTRFDCGHACCCLDCATALLAAPFPRCPIDRVRIRKFSVGPDADGVPIARQDTFESPPSRFRHLMGRVVDGPRAGNALVTNASQPPPPPPPHPPPSLPQSSRQASQQRGTNHAAANLLRGCRVWLFARMSSCCSPRAWFVLCTVMLPVAIGVLAYGVARSTYCALACSECRGLLDCVDERFAPAAPPAVPSLPAAPSPPLEPPAPELPPDDPAYSHASLIGSLAAAAEWLLVRVFDAALVPAGAIMACAWHGIRMRSSGRRGGLSSLCDDCLNACAWLFLGIALAVLGVGMSVVLSSFFDSETATVGCLAAGWLVMVGHARSEPATFVFGGVRYGRGMV